jgi:hypothetical protein
MSGNVNQRVDQVLADIRKTIVNDRSQTHGDPGLFANVFAGMMRPYIDGLMKTGRGFQDADAFNILAIMKLARQSVGVGSFYDHAIDTAGYAVLKAAFTRPDNMLQQGQPEAQGRARNAATPPQAATFAKNDNPPAMCLARAEARGANCSYPQCSCPRQTGQAGQPPSC